MELTQAALNSIKNYRQNEIIMNFVTNEAMEKVAEEIRKEYKGGTTAKAVELLAIKHKNISDRVEDYINAGLIGCYMASFQN